MTWPISVSLAPMIGWPWLAGLGAVAMAAALATVRAGGRGAWLRLLATVAVIAALADPRLVSEQGRTLPDLVLVMVDQSPSQSLGERRLQTERAAAELGRRLGQNPGLEVKVATVDGATDGTRLFAAVDHALADTSRRRLAGVVAITDGQVHDVPADLGRSLGAPVHVLLTGRPDERDRRVVVGANPGFGLIGSGVEIAVRVEDQGSPAQVPLQVRIDGQPHASLSIPVNRDATVEIPIRHRGPTVIELETPEAAGEITTANNRAALSVNGIRDRLKVLLVSGEPHAGGRAWRNLLKSDPAVDLVHFTILRPPDRDDGTPLRDLSLITFPVRELFEQRLGDFDLVILDRFRNRGILAGAYFRNLAAFVRGGGALLAAVGPEMTGPESLDATALRDILPAHPTGRIIERAFHPAPGAAWGHHPILAGLPGTRPEHDAAWGPWVRLIETDPGQGKALLVGPQEQPLVVVDQVGDGRVAMVLSDSAWLWSRGWEGGGPHDELMRRIAHWLMKEPDLEERALTATMEGGRLRVSRRAPEVRGRPTRITGPDGAGGELALSPGDDGAEHGSMEAGRPGLWRVDDPSGLQAVAVAGGPGGPELDEIRATERRLRPVTTATGGTLAWLASDGLPTPLLTTGAATSGRGWMGLRHRAEHQIEAVAETKLVPALVLLIAGLGALILAWKNESAA